MLGCVYKPLKLLYTQRSSLIFQTNDGRLSPMVSIPPSTPRTPLRNIRPPLPFLSSQLPLRASITNYLNRRSWPINKSPSYKPHTTRRAVHLLLHPLHIPPRSTKLQTKKQRCIRILVAHREKSEEDRTPTPSWDYEGDCDRIGR